MKNNKRAGQFIFNLFLISAIMQISVHAAERFEGVWASTRTDCLDKDGPTSRTLIDLTNIVRDKPSPIFDQYENHCKIVSTKANIDNGATLTVMCFEFWDDFRKGVGGKPEKIKLEFARKGNLKIDGAPYKRCEKTRRKGAS